MKKCQLLQLLLIAVFSEMGCNALQAQVPEKPTIDDVTYPVSQIQSIIREHKINRIYVFPEYVLRDQKDPSKVLIGRDVASVKIDTPGKIKEFSEVFIEDVKFTVSIPVRIPNPTDRNTILFIASGDVPLIEWCLFKLKSGWWFMMNWEKPNHERGEFTSFMKCGEKMGKYIDELLAE